MKCERCGNSVKEQDCREFQGKIICEDCYMLALSPAKACDPWVVYSAKSFSGKEGPNTNITKIQSRILQILKETGGVEPEIISERLQLDPSEAFPSGSWPPIIKPHRKYGRVKAHCLAGGEAFTVLKKC